MDSQHEEYQPQTMAGQEMPETASAQASGKMVMMPANMNQQPVQATPPPLKQFYNGLRKIGLTIKEHPWWSVAGLGATVGSTPLVLGKFGCYYMSFCILAGLLVWAIQSKGEE